MKLTIFAATGGIGRQLLEQAIAAGHDVTAVARNPQSLADAAARAVAADLSSADPAALQPAVAGADAVLSALGPRTKADVGVAARGTKVITRAMQAAGVRRIIVVSAAPIGTVPSPAARTRPGTTRATVSSSGTWPTPSSSGRCGRTTPTWPGWKMSFAPATWTGPPSGRRG